MELLKMNMTMALWLTASYKGTTGVYSAELGVKDDFSLVSVASSWRALVDDTDFILSGGKALLDPVFDCRVSSALCTVNNLKLRHVKYRLDSFGVIDLTGFSYKSGLKVNCALRLSII